MERLEEAIREAVPEWSLVELVTAVQAMRGFDLIAAVGVVAETGDPWRRRALHTSDEIQATHLVARCQCE